MELRGEYASSEAGEYTAKIKITGGNYIWTDSETEPVTIEWRIEKASFDLNGVEWDYSGPYTYTIKDGKAVVHRVGLKNLAPELLEKIEYTTNGKAGANGGINAGKYETTFDFGTLGANYELPEIPEELKKLEWRIEKRRLPMYTTESRYEVYNEMPHYLLDLFELPKDWEEYFTITVYYWSESSTLPLPYEGYEGDPYVAFNAGEYRLHFQIKEGINVDKDHVNVVWSKNPTTDLKEPPAEQPPAVIPPAEEPPEAQRPEGELRMDGKTYKDDGEERRVKEEEECVGREGGEGV